MLLSVSLIVKNEAKNLPTCLNALQPLLKAVDSELIIVDTGSTDNTVAIARQFTDNILQVEWRDDFAWARNQGLQVARGEWFMFIDADEVLEDPTELIRFFIKNEYKRYGSMFYSISNIFNGTVNSKFLVSRLVKRTPQVGFVGAIHEQLVHTEKPAGKLLSTNFFHSGYDFAQDFDKWEYKNLRNYASVSQAYLDAPDDSSKLLDLINQLHVICMGERGFQTTFLKSLDAKQALFHHLDIGLERNQITSTMDSLYYCMFVDRYTNAVAFFKENTERLATVLEAYLTSDDIQYTNYPKLCFALAGCYTDQGDYLKAMQWYETGLAVWEQEQKRPFLVGTLYNTLTYGHQDIFFFHTQKTLAGSAALQTMKNSEHPVDALLDYVFDNQFLQGHNNTNWIHDVSQLLLDYLLEGTHTPETNQDLFNAFVLVRSEYLRTTNKSEDKEQVINRFVLAVDKAYTFTGYPLIKALKKALNLLPAFGFVVTPMVEQLEQAMVAQ